MRNGIINDDTKSRVGMEDPVKLMRKSKRYTWISGLLIVLSIALLMFVGCSSNAVKYTDNTTDDKFEYFFDATQRDQNQAGPALFELTETVVSEVVGVVGGTVEVAGETGADFIVPVGALLTPVEITLEVTKIQTPLGPIYVYDCGPDGTKFKVPAKLQQPITSGQAYAFLYYFNESTGRWELQEIVKVKDGVATFNIKHFSKYGIS